MASFIQQLRIAIDGLTYPSESDEPFEVFTWPATTTARFAVQTNAKSTAISEQTPGTFFDELLGDPQSDSLPTSPQLKAWSDQATNRAFSTKTR